MMSVIQWTPQMALAVTMKPVKPHRRMLRMHLSVCRFPIRRASCIRAVGMMHRTSRVVEEG